MWNAESLNREQIREFLKSSQPIEFAGCGRGEKYAWVELVLEAQQYAALDLFGDGLPNPESRAFCAWARAERLLAHQAASRSRNFVATFVFCAFGRLPRWRTIIEP